MRIRPSLVSLLLLCTALPARSAPLSTPGLTWVKPSVQTIDQALLYEHMGPTHPDQLADQASRHGRRSPDRFDELLELPEVQAALATIRFAEGADYNRLFGYFTDNSRVFDHLRQVGHPRSTFRSPGGYVSSAAGAYQALPSTWDEEVRRGSMENRFTPYEQDRFALARLEFRGVLDEVVEGNIWWIRSRATGHEWASFPSSPYAQPRKSRVRLERFYRAQLAHFRQASKASVN